MVELIQRQYRASLAMLEQAVRDCPEPLWLASGQPNRYWHIAYHALFYTHLYLQPSEKQFIPPPSHREGSNDLGATGIEPYSQSEILNYIGSCRDEVARSVPALGLDAPSGFFWLPFSRFELHLYNVRHIQHHTGQLAGRLRDSAGIGINWIAQA